MKAETFVVAFCLVGAAAWFTYAKHAGNLNIEGIHSNEQTIVINSDGFYEEMKYAGSVQFNEEETAIAAISPGGYLKYTLNEQQLNAVADSSGHIVYTLSRNGRVTNDSPELTRFITEAVKETIAWGLDAKPRMERVYRRGGNPALLKAIDSLKNGNLKVQYADRVYRTDSVSTADLELLLLKLRSINGNDYEKEQLLKKFSPAQLADSSVFNAYLQSVTSVHADDAKTNLLKKLIDLPSLQQHFAAVVSVISSTDNDEEKARAYNAIISKGKADSSNAAVLLEGIKNLHNEDQQNILISSWLAKNNFPASQVQALLNLISGLGNEQDKEALYKKLAATGLHTEEDWILLLQHVALITQNELKAGLLIALSQTMPKTARVQAAYTSTAKTITTDADYGRAIRAAL